MKLCFCKCYEETQTEEIYFPTYIHEGRLEISNPDIIFNGLLHRQYLWKIMYSVHIPKWFDFPKCLEINSENIFLKSLDLDHWYSLIIPVLHSKYLYNQIKRYVSFLFGSFSLTQTKPTFASIYYRHLQYLCCFFPLILLYSGTI